MGCDIHLYVERRDQDGIWHSLDTWNDDPDEPGRKSVYKWGPGFEQLAGPIYRERNYDLFAILADVRNGRGFAGCDTGDGFNPIAAPRGVPDDASPEYAAEVASWDGNGHSHSWLTLGELLCYDWTQTTKRRGWVGPSDWARWRDYGRPDSWCGDIWGGKVTHHSNADFEAAWQKVRATKGYPENRHAAAHIGRKDPDGMEDTAAFIRHLGGAPYTQVEWVVSYHDACSGFWSDCVPKLLALSQGRFNDLRIVFFFDN